ncbi:MAG: tetratricopeptide repeat protein [Anaerolineae bacterium]|nr:tetratricopeptide repeat protein [Anaerolineae bacterium]
MRLLKPFLTGLIILLPIGTAFILPLSAHPTALVDARMQVFAANQQMDETAELSALETELSFAPWQGEEWQRLGRLRLNNGKPLGAVDAFDQAASLGALTTEGKLWLTDALITTGDAERAKALLREFSRVENVDAFVFLQAAMTQRSLNDTYGALATLLKAYGIDPLNGEINYQIGLQFAAVEPDKALPFLETAGNLIPTRQADCDSLTRLINDSGEVGETSLRYQLIGQELATMEEWDVAQGAFTKATALDDADGVAWALLAEAAQQNGEDGEQFITKSQELAPYAELVNGLSGLYYRRQGKNELAIEYLQKAADANPRAVVWEIEMATTLDGMGDRASALIHFQNAVDIDPQNYLPWRALAVFSLTRSYEVETIGLTAARMALQLNPGSPALMDLLGTMLMKIGKLDEALIYFLQADEIDPHQTAILIHLGQLYLAQGEKEKAFEVLRQAVEYARDSRLREMAFSILKENNAAK